MDLPVLAFCIVCTDPIKVYALGECNHRNLCAKCYVMGMKQYQRRDCVTCSRPFGSVIVTGSGTKDFSAFDFSSMRVSHQFENTYFDGRPQLKLFEDLYATACPRCSLKCKSKNDLVTHCLKEHQLHFCKVCLHQRKGIVIRQQRLYTADGLREHKRNGDPATDTEGAIPAHLSCSLCAEKTMNSDSLAYHMIEKHICCQLCRRRNMEEWVANDKYLIEHYKAAHLTCDDPMCCAAPMENVYDNEISFQSHMLKVHGSNLKSKEMLKKTQRINIAFDRRPPSAPSDVNVTTSAVASYQDINYDTTDPKEQNRVLINEIRRVKGDDGFAEFRRISANYFSKSIDTETYYEQFCDMFRGCTTAASIWMLLVSSLPNPDLRADLHRVHYESVQNGGGFNIGSRQGRPVSRQGKVSNKTNAGGKKQKRGEANKRSAADAQPGECLSVDAISEAGVGMLNIAPSTSGNEAVAASDLKESLPAEKGGEFSQVDSKGTDNGGKQEEIKPPASQTGGGKKGRFKKKEVLYRL